MRIIDTHGHVQMIRDANFKTSIFERCDIEEARKKFPEPEFLTDEERCMFLEMEKNGVIAVVSPATELSDLAKTLEYGKNVPGVYTALGVHPLAVDDWKKEAGEVKRLLEPNIDSAHIVAIGEIGMDFHLGREKASRQESLLRAQFEIALKHNLPVILHMRDCTDELLKIVSEYAGELRGVFHFFSGGLDIFNEITNLGFFVGIGALITYKGKSKDPIRQNIFSIPEEKRHRVVVETDAPYLAPGIYRGEKNYPGLVRLTLERLAEGWEMDPEAVGELTTRNAENLFGKINLREWFIGHQVRENAAR